MPELTFSHKQAATIRKPFQHTLEVNEGTPRSGKTTAGIFRAARYYIETEDSTHLITGFNQEQAYKLFIEGDGLGLRYIFDGCCKIKHDDNGDHLELHTPKGLRRIYYKGGGKADSHKAILGMSFGSVVFCEINVLHMDMVQECFRRTFAAKNRWHLADLNPPAPQHPVIKEVFEVQDTDWQHWSIQDNPIITPARMEELRQVLLKNPYLYARDWEGRRVIPVGVIYAMFDPVKHTKSSLPQEAKVKEMFFAGDGGQGDATSLSCNLVIHDGKRYRLVRAANYYHSGKDTGNVKAMSTYAVELKSFMDWCVNKFKRPRGQVFIDPACKSLREELHKIGVPTQAANNNSHEHIRGNKGIEVGIERCQNIISEGDFFLLESEQFGHYDFLREIGMYCRDDTGKPIDLYNHAMDEFRYSVNYFYRQYAVANKPGGGDGA